MQLPSTNNFQAEKLAQAAQHDHPLEPDMFFNGR